jgi:hypothetical protein
MDGEGSKEGEGRTRERRKKGGRETGGRTEGRADGSVYRTGERPHWAPNCETERKERTGRTPPNMGGRKTGGTSSASKIGTERSAQ